MLRLTAIVAVGVRLCRVKCRAAEEAADAAEDKVEEEAAETTNLPGPVPERAAQSCLTTP